MLTPRHPTKSNNMMYATAGHLITKLTGLDLGAFFRRYLWAPMGMHETFLGDYDPALPGSGLSAAHGYWWVGGASDDGQKSPYVLMPDVDVRTGEGAGAVLSNVLDYARYLRVMMTEAGPVSKAGHRELKRPRTFHHLTEDIVGVRFQEEPVLPGLRKIFGQASFYQETSRDSSRSPFPSFHLTVRSA